MTYSILCQVGRKTLTQSAGEMCSRIDMQTHAWPLGLGFDLLTSGSVHAEVLSWTIQGGPKKVIPLEHYITLYERYHFFWPTLYVYRLWC